MGPPGSLGDMFGNAIAVFYPLRGRGWSATAIACSSTTIAAS